MLIRLLLYFIKSIQPSCMHIKICHLKTKTSKNWTHKFFGLKCLKCKIDLIWSLSVTNWQPQNTLIPWKKTQTTDKTFSPLFEHPELRWCSDILSKHYGCAHRTVSNKDIRCIYLVRRFCSWYYLYKWTKFNSWTVC